MIWVNLYGISPVGSPSSWVSICFMDNKLNMNHMLTVLDWNSQGSRGAIRTTPCKHGWDDICSPWIHVFYNIALVQFLWLHIRELIEPAARRPHGTFSEQDRRTFKPAVQLEYKKHRCKLKHKQPKNTNRNTVQNWGVSRN